MMLDWNDYHKQVQALVAAIGRSSPGTVRGYRELSNAGATDESDGCARREDGVVRVRP